jgi:hypothetical protein
MPDLSGSDMPRVAVIPGALLPELQNPHQVNLPHPRPWLARRPKAVAVCGATRRAASAFGVRRRRAVARRICGQALNVFTVAKLPQAAALILSPLQAIHRSTAPGAVLPSAIQWTRAPGAAQLLV